MDENTRRRLKVIIALAVEGRLVRSTANDAFLNSLIEDIVSSVAEFIEQMEKERKE